MSRMTDAQLETLSSDECLRLLRENTVGRLGIVVDDAPAVLPVNYRLVESHGTTGGTWIALRTRPGNVIDRAPTIAAFEIDGVDASRREGWSVLVRGELSHIDLRVARERFDSEPWLDVERDAWLIVTPFQITGRRLHSAEPSWTLPSGVLTSPQGSRAPRRTDPSPKGDSIL
jgi:hypothetical protein